MKVDKYCSNCEWWEHSREPDSNGNRKCLRWPGLGNPWLWTKPRDRCWQHSRWTSETKESMTYMKDLRSATRLVLTAGLTTGPANTCIDLIVEVLGQMRDRDNLVRDLQDNIARANPRLQSAQELLRKATFSRRMPGDWDEEALKWLQNE